MVSTTQALTTHRNGTAPPRPKISTHLLLVAPKQAREILATEGYPQQRPLRPHHVAYVRGLIERGAFRLGTTIAFARLGEQRYLINGQHTLTALGQTTGGPLWLQIEETRVETLEVVGELYESYDRNLARSWTDLYRADQRLQHYDLVPKHLNLLGSAMRHLATGFVQHVGFAKSPTALQIGLLKDARVRFALMAEWSSEMQNFVTGCQGPGAVRKLLTRAAVLSVALVTYRFQPEAAHLFWPSIARDSGLSESQPAHSLLRFLRDTPTRKYEPATYSRMVAACWNAAFDDRPMHRLVGRSATQPLLLLGTPHDGHVTKRYLDEAGRALAMPQAWAERQQEAADGEASSRVRATW